jgi:hypothetical protein
MGGTLRTRNSEFEILRTPLSLKYKTAEEKINRICSMVKFVEQNLIK